MTTNTQAARKWHPFDKAKGYHQKRPPVGRPVLVLLPPNAINIGCGTTPHGIAVGYRKNAAGDKSCPYFVIPGIGGEPVAWCDCLGYDEVYQMWSKARAADAGWETPNARES
jgi:hypothetical protein